MKHIKLALLMLVVISSTACTEVLPRQRGNLALSQMALTPDALEFGLRQHTSFSKEAASGGYGGGGGGCGCN
ncbi:MAG: DUF4266 domain-containing protein [Methylococcales bacterium]|nr:DUF4266 domain-containing protein [Methylococcales bacterium]